MFSFPEPFQVSMLLQQWSPYIMQQIVQTFWLLLTMHTFEWLQGHPQACTGHCSCVFANPQQDSINAIARHAVSCTITSVMLPPQYHLPHCNQKPAVLYIICSVLRHATMLWWLRIPWMRAPLAALVWAEVMILISSITMMSVPVGHITVVQLTCQTEVC